MGNLSISSGIGTDNSRITFTGVISDCCNDVPNFISGSTSWANIE